MWDCVFLLSMSGFPTSSVPPAQAHYSLFCLLLFLLLSPICASLSLQDTQNGEINLKQMWNIIIVWTRLLKLSFCKTIPIYIYLFLIENEWTYKDREESKAKTYWQLLLRVCLWVAVKAEVWKQPTQGQWVCWILFMTWPSPAEQKLSQLHNLRFMCAFQRPDVAATC